MKGKANVARGHNPAPILGKGCFHQLRNEYIPDIDDELDEFFMITEELDEDSSESTINFALSI